MFYLWPCLLFKLVPWLSQNKWSIWKFTMGVLLNFVASWDLPKLNFKLGVLCYWDSDVARVERVLKRYKMFLLTGCWRNTKSIVFLIFQLISLWLLIMFNSFILPSVFTDTKVKLVCVMSGMHQNQNNLMLCPPDTSKEETIFIYIWFDQLFFKDLNCFSFGDFL